MERPVTTRRRTPKPYALAAGCEPLESRILYSFTFSSIAAFSGKHSGIQPMSLVVDGDGNIFGTTARGGAKKYGTIFEIPAGTDDIITLASFNSKNGLYPTGSLVLDANGVLWGTTANGGSSQRGTIFSFNTADTTSGITTVFNFNGANGSYPLMGLVADASGTLYGTTLGSVHGRNASILFSLSSDGTTLTRLATFSPKDALNGGLVVDSSGNIFGTTARGGTKHAGSVFEFPAGATGSTVTTLASFTVTNGYLPTNALIIDDNGNLVGTTGGGGSRSRGTLFQFNVTANTITTLANFHGSDGSRPVGSIVQDSSGNFFGVTALGGIGNRGVVFEYPAGSTTSSVTRAFAFTGSRKGRVPSGGLVIDANDNLFGTTYLGGIGNRGTLFELAPGGAAEPEPASSTASLTTSGGVLQLGSLPATGTDGQALEFHNSAGGGSLEPAGPILANHSTGTADCLTLGSNSAVTSLVGITPITPGPYTIQPGMGIVNLAQGTLQLIGAR
jgi:uncharacterized repeat protein (TIGR03803 family)